jgi:hypothetical protein
MRPSRLAARLAVVLGALAVLLVPAGIVASRYVSGVTLLQSLYYAVPASFVLGLLAWAASRKARYRLARSLSERGLGPVRLGRFLAWAGLYVAFTGAVALGVYAGLHAAG